jgi:uncharacterized protein YbjQ (UPF0145 family)
VGLQANGGSQGEHHHRHRHQPVTEYVGVVAGEAVLGANVFRDLFAGLRDIVGGCSASYEKNP